MKIKKKQKTKKKGWRSTIGMKNFKKGLRGTIGGFHTQVYCNNSGLWI